MRVAYVVNQAIGTAGWGRYAVELIRAIQPMGVEPVLITASPDCDPALRGIEQHPILPGVMQHRFETPRSLLRAPRLRSILKTCDVVQCITELYAPLVALAAPRQMPFIVNAHGTWAIRPLEIPQQRIFFVPAFRRADKVICQSRFTHQWMARLMDLPQAVVLTGGVTPADYQQAVEADLPAWVQHQRVALNTAGAFKPRKGQQIAVEAVALARQHIPNLRLVFTGRLDPDSNAYAADLVQQIQVHGLEDAVYFAGVVPQETLIAWYQQADVLLHTPINAGSSFEGLGLIYLEAAAAGLPSIGSQNCGAEDAIINGETGLTVPQNDPAAAADALLQILMDDERRIAMSAAARQLADRLTWHQLAAATRRIYQDLYSQ